MASLTRKPAVAGQFYPADPSQLTTTLRQHLPPVTAPRRAMAIVVPHAGYLYSGDVAGDTYARVVLPRRFIILCPNHRGLGSPLSIMREGAWETPLGLVPIDEELANRLCRTCVFVQESPCAHRSEHALEVQLPFLQHLLNNDFRFVPITLAKVPYENLLALGTALGEVVRQTPEPVLLIASSDMNHHESVEHTLRKDQLAIEKIIKLDSQGLYDVVHQENVSMCGYGATICVMQAARVLGATQAHLVSHTHSGKTTGDLSKVVGYAGFVID